MMILILSLNQTLTRLNISEAKLTRHGRAKGNPFGLLCSFLRQTGNRRNPNVVALGQLLESHAFGTALAGLCLRSDRNAGFS
jgi:hypothetical protein